MENKTQENLKLLSLVPIDVQEKKFQNINVNIRKSNDTSKRRTRRI